MKKTVLEICCGDISSVKAAREGGADRIEICSALSEGGLTPSGSFIKKAVEEFKPGKVNVLIRHRGGDFLYDEDEISIMVEEIKTARECGASGVVTGALTADGDIDTEACRRFVNAAQGMSKTFSRAFDLTRSPMDALEEIISLGYDRILTSGAAPSVTIGKEMLAKFKEAAGDRIIIMAGCGVNSGNALETVSSTGVSEIHASASKPVSSKMRYRNPDIAMGKAGEDEYTRKTTDIKEVKEIIKRLN